MKVTLWLTIFAVIWLPSLGRRHMSRNGNCMVKNPMPKMCKGPLRLYYTFSRTLLDCVPVYTKCTKVNKRNEYHSEKKCKDDCYYFMQLPKKPWQFGSTVAWGHGEAPVNPPGPEITRRTTTTTTTTTTPPADETHLDAKEVQASPTTEESGTAASANEE
ncbi:uncharacterized protein LOC108036076 [Drosophila biarmipes]|uniref:uncharacterized protein LOC108036076 n=1 Tax=Drosophila biarmipes TaxID=125945 RepID=UPI0007E85F1D|nr:uncharacterized protein LOC108036076 [Drosophila biarmipes]